METASPRVTNERTLNACVRCHDSTKKQEERPQGDFLPIFGKLLTIP
ncbi:MAG: hypothetical protein J6D19_03385 [Clostridia bacterium]|nr:hypothetical protein [Clostridia bacterium]